MARLTRRAVLAALAALLPPPLAAAAQEAWPSRPGTLLVPYAPGGSNDVVARLLAPHPGSLHGLLKTAR